MSPSPSNSGGKSGGEGTRGANLKPIMRFKVIEQIRMIETYIISNASREITISHTMKKTFLLQTTTRRKSGLSNVCWIQN